MSTRARLALALDQISYERGFDFERFVLAFLAGEMQELRPVGGMHDGGRDAFLHSASAQPDVFVQCSVTGEWQQKIRGTVKTLQKNGFSVRELIYCSNHIIQADADALRGELRRKNITLDVRDREYFLSRAEVGEGQRAAAEDLSRLLVDPLLTSRGVLERASLSLSAEEERVATTYLQMALQDRDPSRGLSKLCFEAIVTFALREASPDALVSRQELLAQIVRQVRGGEPTRLAVLTDKALNRLVKKDLVKHHKNVDSFTLSFAYREEMKRRVERLLEAETAVRTAAKSFVTRAATELGINYAFPVDAVAEDAIRILDYVIYEQGRLAAAALVDRGVFAALRRDVDSIARELVPKARQSFRSLATLTDEQFFDLVPITVEYLAAASETAITNHFKILSDAYCLQFMLQQTTDVQEAISKIVSGVTLLVDTSIIITAMSERVRPREDQRMTNLLRAAKLMGCRLIAGDDVLNELDTHLDRIGYNYRMGQVPNQAGIWLREYSAPLLEQSYKDAVAQGLFSGTFDDYIVLFKGQDSPLQDLIEYMKSELGISYSELGKELSAISESDLGDLFDQWKRRKHRRRWVEERSFETLVMHDVRAFLIVEYQRKSSVSDAGYGHRWWWLAIDGAAIHFDRERHGKAIGARVCMSPDFFARYLSLASKSNSVQSANAMIPPAALHLASLGLVPPEVRREAERIYESLRDEPEYLRRRRLRDLVNKAMATSADEDSTDANSLLPEEAE